MGLSYIPFVVRGRHVNQSPTRVVVVIEVADVRHRSRSVPDVAVGARSDFNDVVMANHQTRDRDTIVRIKGTIKGLEGVVDLNGVFSVGHIHASGTGLRECKSRCGGNHKILDGHKTTFKIVVVGDKTIQSDYVGNNTRTGNAIGNRRAGNGFHLIHLAVEGILAIHTTFDHIAGRVFLVHRAIYIDGGTAILDEGMEFVFRLEQNRQIGVHLVDVRIVCGSLERGEVGHFSESGEVIDCGAHMATFGAVNGDGLDGRCGVHRDRSGIKSGRSGRFGAVNSIIDVGTFGFTSDAHCLCGIIVASGRSEGRGGNCGGFGKLVETASHLVAGVTSKSGTAVIPLQQTRRRIHIGNSKVAAVEVNGPIVMVVARSSGMGQTVAGRPSNVFAFEQHGVGVLAIHLGNGYLVGIGCRIGLNAVSGDIRGYRFVSTIYGTRRTEPRQCH